MDWRTIAPIVSTYQALIDGEVKADTKKLYSYEAFAGSATEEKAAGITRGRAGFGEGSTPSFKGFVTERREYLLNHPALSEPTPTIASIDRVSDASAGKAVQLAVQIGRGVRPDAVMLYYASSADRSFAAVPMLDDGKHADGKAGDGVFGAGIPPFPAGTVVRYYVEARAGGANAMTRFAPERSERGALSYAITPLKAARTQVVINELMASNTADFRDPQGDADDWIELCNVGTTSVDLAGMYLTDSEDDPRKWVFPEGTVIPPAGYLIVWADQDVLEEPGIHADFRISMNGEILLLIDSDARENRVLDSVRFGPQQPGVALGRYPDATGEFRPMVLTPGRRNEP